VNVNRIDARGLLASLQGRVIPTLTGRPNRVGSLDREYSQELDDALESPPVLALARPLRRTLLSLSCHPVLAPGPADSRYQAADDRADPSDESGHDRVGQRGCFA
jgi:hypothetical protein